LFVWKFNFIFAREFLRRTQIFDGITDFRITKNLKMEREELISKISEKVGRTNVSEQTIGNFVDSFPLADGVEPTEDYIANVANFFGKSVSGNISLEAANAVKPLNEQIATLTEQIDKLKRQSTTSKGDDSLQEMMNTLNELKSANEELKSQFSALTTQQTQQQITAQIIQKMKDSKAQDEYVLRNTILKHGKIDTTKSVDELVKDLLKEYDTEFTACRGEGAVPRTTQLGGSSAESESIKKAREEYKQRLIRAGKLPKPQI
jgi:DNA repair exonuclease SbcCD ATPase subunit